MAPVSLSGSATTSAQAITPYAQVTGQLSDSTYRISSGYRFLPSEGSPDISTAQLLQGELSTYRQGQQNGAASNSLLDTAASGLNQIGVLLDTLSGLATQASDQNITSQQRFYLQAAFADGLNQINSIAGGTSFGGINLLDGSASAFDGGAAVVLTTGYSPAGDIHADIRSVTTARLFGGSTPDLTSAANATAAATAVTNAQALFQPVAGAVAGYQAQVFFAGQNLEATIGGIDAARRVYTDTDFPSELQRFTDLTNQRNIALAVLSQARNLSPYLLGLLHAPALSASAH